MKISITANTSWYIYNFRRNTIVALVNAGYEVIVISPDSEYKERLEGLGCKCIQITMQRWGKNPLFDLKTFFDFYLIFKREKIFITLNFTPKNNIYATFAAKLSNVKVINNIAGLGVAFIHDNFFSKLVSLLYKLSQKNADFIFFQNEDDRKLFTNLGIVSSNKSDRLPGSGVDLSRFEYSPLIVKKESIRFLLVARLIAEKGIYLYVEAARQLKPLYPTVEFCLLGPLDASSSSAITNEEIEEWKEEGLINYLGFTDSVEIELRKADCIVLPSYYREGVPKSLLEAGAIGRPIITTDNVGCKEVVDNEYNGFLCEPKSVISLTSCLKKFIELEFYEKETMGFNSRKKIQQKFDEKIIIDKYLSEINKIVNIEQSR
ncbi:glycosyltransferase family 4 protein [Aeromonas media]|uniref:glycosyltransferase family 4 protein n=1 Tax=Aeromonas media TaxID=651 RepID=UPI003CFD45C3